MCGRQRQVAIKLLRLIDSCITQFKVQGPSRTCNESREELARQWSSSWLDVRGDQALKVDSQGQVDFQEHVDFREHNFQQRVPTGM